VRQASKQGSGSSAAQGARRKREKWSPAGSQLQPGQKRQVQMAPSGGAAAAAAPPARDARASTSSVNAEGAGEHDPGAALAPLRRQGDRGSGRRKASGMAVSALGEGPGGAGGGGAGQLAPIPQWRGGPGHPAAPAGPSGAPDGDPSDRRAGAAGWGSRGGFGGLRPAVGAVQGVRGAGPGGGLPPNPEMSATRQVLMGQGGDPAGGPPWAGRPADAPPGAAAGHPGPAQVAMYGGSMLGAGGLDRGGQLAPLQPLQGGYGGKPGHVGVLGALRGTGGVRGRQAGL